MNEVIKLQGLNEKAEDDLTNL